MRMVRLGQVASYLKASALSLLLPKVAQGGSRVLKGTFWQAQGGTSGLKGIKKCSRRLKGVQVGSRGLKGSKGGSKGQKGAEDGTSGIKRAKRDSKGLKGAQTGSRGLKAPHGYQKISYT